MKTILVLLIVNRIFLIRIISWQDYPPFSQIKKRPKVTKISSANKIPNFAHLFQRCSYIEKLALDSDNSANWKEYEAFFAVDKLPITELIIRRKEFTPVTQ